VLIQVLEYPPTKPFSGRDRMLADLSSLRPYGKGKVWNRSIWDKYIRDRQIESKKKTRNAILDSTVKAGYMYLNRILKAARGKDVVEEVVEKEEYDSDFETPYEVNHKLPDKASLQPLPEFSDKKKEPLRPGDVIEYCSPIYCAGDPRGLRKATVVSTDPESTGYKVGLSNQEVLPNETRVKRVKVLENGKLFSHNGFYRIINQFVLKKRSLNIDEKDLMKKRSEQIGRIVDRNANKLRANMEKEGVPVGFVQGLTSRRKQVASDRLIDQQLRQRKNASSSDGSSSSYEVSSFQKKGQKESAWTKKKEEQRVKSSFSSSDDEDPPTKRPTKRLPSMQKKPEPIKERPSSLSKEDRGFSSDSDSSLDIVGRTTPSPKSKVRAKNVASVQSDSSRSNRSIRMSQTKSSGTRREIPELSSPNNHRRQLPIKQVQPKSAQSVLSDSSSSSHKARAKPKSKKEGSGLSGLSSPGVQHRKLPTRKLTPTSMKYYEYDSESSMENEGLSLKTREVASIQKDHPSSMEDRNLSLQAKRVAPTQKDHLSSRGEVKAISIDRKTERILPAKRRYLPDMVAGDSQEPSLVLSKVNSKKAPVRSPKVKKSAAIARQTTSPLTKADVMDLSMSDNDPLERSSQGSEFFDLAGTKQESKTSKKLSPTGSSSGERLKDRNGRQRPQSAQHLLRRKARGPYRIKEDDIEDSDEEQRVRATTPKRIPKRAKKYQAVARMSSSSKGRYRDL
jgi:hypothetical protein